MRGVGEWWFLGESITLRRFASFPSQPFPGPFTNGLYGVALTISCLPLGSRFRGNDGVIAGMAGACGGGYVIQRLLGLWVRRGTRKCLWSRFSRS